MATNTTETTVKPAKLLTNDEKMKRIPSVAQQALDLGGLLVTISKSVLVRSRSGGSTASGTTDPPTYSDSASTGGGSATS